MQKFVSFPPSQTPAGAESLHKTSPPYWHAWYEQSAPYWAVVQVLPMRGRTEGQPLCGCVWHDQMSDNGASASAGIPPVSGGTQAHAPPGYRRHRPRHSAASPSTARVVIHLAAGSDARATVVNRRRTASRRQRRSSVGTKNAFGHEHTERSARRASPFHGAFLAADWRGRRSMSSDPRVTRAGAPLLHRSRGRALASRDHPSDHFGDGPCAVRTGSGVRRAIVSATLAITSTVLAESG
jgi:hypothetical protein